MRSFRICCEAEAAAEAAEDQDDVAVDKFDFAPVQSPDMRSSRCKKILVQGDAPQKLSVNLLLWVKGAILGVKNKKMKTKIGLLLTLFFKLAKQFYKLKGLWGQFCDIISKHID